MDGALGVAGEVSGGPAGGVVMDGTAGVEMEEVEVMVVLRFMVIGGAGTTGVLIVALFDMSDMLDSPLVGSLSMGSTFETAAESGLETVVIKGGRTRRPFDLRISLILSCWTPMWRSRRPELAKVF